VKEADDDKRAIRKTINDNNLAVTVRRAGRELELLSFKSVKPNTISRRNRGIDGQFFILKKIECGNRDVCECRTLELTAPFPELPKSLPKSINIIIINITELKGT
jgi:hypothetical protein